MAGEKRFYKSLPQRKKNMNFDRPIFENARRKGRPLLAAHRGINGANIPYNTLLSYQIAIDQGADVVELDVSRSKDGVLFAFHPGMEPVCLKCGHYLSELTAAEIKEIPILNCDEVPTHYRIPTLREAFALLKDKVYINVDKFWTAIPQITEEIRRTGVEKQVIVKTFTDEESLSAVERFAPDLMFMPLVRKTDDTTDMLLKRGIHFIGNEILFETEQDEVIRDDYIKKLHDRGLIVWMNAIVYDEHDVISAYHTDDASLEKGPQFGWGWLAEKQADFIQTDWLLAARTFLEGKKS